MKALVEKFDNVIVVYLVLLVVDAALAFYLNSLFGCLLAGIGIGLCCALLYVQHRLDRFARQLDAIKELQAAAEHRIAFAERRVATVCSEVTGEQPTIH